MEGTLTRRRFIGDAVVALPLATILADPGLARAAAATLETVSLTTAGGQAVEAAIARPAKSSAPAVMLIHEWWGLNDQIKAVAAEFAKNDMLALAIDLYGGKSATDRETASALVQAVDQKAATDVCVSWLRWLKTSAGGSGRVGTIGWCFGGAWSLKASLAEPVDATVIYYGRVPTTPGELEPLKGPVQGHFATRDQYITEAMVNDFAEAMAIAGKSLELHWYQADHAFANPTGDRYDKANAEVAWSRTLRFLNTNLG